MAFICTLFKSKIIISFESQHLQCRISALIWILSKKKENDVSLVIALERATPLKILLLAAPVNKQKHVNHAGLIM